MMENRQGLAISQEEIGRFFQYQWLEYNPNEAYANFQGLPESGLVIGWNHGKPLTRLVMIHDDEKLGHCGAIWP